MPIDTLIAYAGVYSDVDDALADYDAIKDLHTEAGTRSTRSTPR